MTCIAAIRTSTGCVIGADGRVTSDDHVFTDTCVKVRKFGAIVVAVCGSDGRALEDLMQGKAKRFADVLSYVQARRGATSNDEDYGFLIYDSMTHRLLTLAADGTEVTYPRIATDGAGGLLALGALSAMPDVMPRIAVRRALEIAIKYNNTCGGKIRVVEMQRR